jgi:thiosulfate dehydrogenase [quinone] large subunit
MRALPTVDQVTDERGKVLIPGPAPARFLFKNTQMSWFWLIVRVWVGWQWLEASWRKLSNPTWMDGSGRAIRGFWEKALAGTTPGGEPVITYDWYRGFIQLLVDNRAEGWFSKLIAFGELTVGIALILGALTGVAAAGGLLMSESYMLAGTASNPVLALCEILLIFAWKTAGYIGLDRYILPTLTPWWDERHPAAPSSEHAPPPERPNRRAQVA